jgi:branched-chain amino acid aminotransferase
MELGQHLARLRRSASELDIALPAGAESQIGAGIVALLVAEGLDSTDGDASIRITISRGSTLSREVLPRDGNQRATIAIQVWRLPLASTLDRSRGVQLVVSQVRRDPRNPLAAIKTTSRVEHVYARLEARRAGADDALFLTIHDHLSEATSSNLFLIRRGSDGVVELATPSLDCAILDGTTRAWVLAWARRVGLRPFEGHLVSGDLLAADEAFLTSSVAGIMPIAGFEGRPIGSGGPGTWAQRARADRDVTTLGGGSGQTPGPATGTANK